MNGFGLEFYIETPGSELADSGQDIKSSWQFQLLYTVSQLAAGKSVQSVLWQLAHKLQPSMHQMTACALYIHV